MSANAIAGQPSAVSPLGTALVPMSAPATAAAAKAPGGGSAKKAGAVLGPGGIFFPEEGPVLSEPMKQALKVCVCVFSRPRCRPGHMGPV
jgi:hypothetical protein